MGSDNLNMLTKTFYRFFVRDTIYIENRYWQGEIFEFFLLKVLVINKIEVCAN